MSELKKIVKGSIFVFISFAVASVFGYLSKILLARQLGPSEFGLYSLALTVVYLFTSFAIAGVGTSISYYLSKEKERSKKNAFFSALFLISLVSLLLLSLLIIIFPTQIATVFGNNNLIKITYFIAGFTFLYGTTRVVYSILRGEEQSKIFSVFYVVTPIIYFVGVYSMQIVTAYNALLYYIITYLIVDVFVLPYIFKKVKFVRPNFMLVKKVFSFSVVLFLVEVLFSLRKWIDIWMLSLFSNVLSIGFYNVAALSAFAFNITLMSVDFLYLPVANKLLHEGKLKRLRVVYNKICFILTLLVSPFVVALVLFAPQFIVLIFGNKYLPAVVPFSILIVATFVNVILGPNWTNLIIQQEKKCLVILAIITLAVNIVFNYLTIPMWGITGTAVSTAISIILWNLMTTIVIWEKQRITPFSREMFSLIIISLILAIPILVIQHYILLSILPTILVGLVYLGVYILLVNNLVIPVNEAINFVVSMKN